MKYVKTRGKLKVLLLSLLVLFAFFCLRSVHAANPVLKGEVQAGILLKLAEAGLECIKAGNAVLPAKVVNVKPHSQADNEGVSPGDLILSVTPKDNTIDIVEERNGQKYSLNLTCYPDFAKPKAAVTHDAKTEQPMLAEIKDIPPPTGWKEPPNARAETMQEQNPEQAIPAESATNTTLSSSVSEQRKILAAHDVVILIDKSGSMNTKDCPDGLSRWEWCKKQAVSLAQESESYLPEGITLVVFSNDSRVFPHAHVKEIADVFEKYSPGGSTNTGTALYDRLKAYIDARQANSKTTKPIVIAVITDGEPTDGRMSANSIISATRQMHKPDEISITFLQVGYEVAGTAVLNELNSKLVEEGAKYDIVDLRTFPELLQSGLRASLVHAILEPRLKPQPEGSESEHSDSFFEHLRTNLEKKWLKRQAKQGE